MYRLDVSNRDENIVAQCLVDLAVKEPGENWVGERFDGKVRVVFRVKAVSHPCPPCALLHARARRYALSLSLSLSLSRSLSLPLSLSLALLRASEHGRGRMHALCFFVCVPALVHLMLIFVMGGSKRTGDVSVIHVFVRNSNFPQHGSRKCPKKGI